MTTVFTVPEVHCDNCVAAITGALEPLGGVHAVDVDLQAKTVTVAHEAPASTAALAALIEDQGYELTGVDSSS